MSKLRNLFRIPAFIIVVMMMGGMIYGIGKILLSILLFEELWIGVTEYFAWFFSSFISVGSKNLIIPRFLELIGFLAALLQKNLLKVTVVHVTLTLIRIKLTKPLKEKAIKKITEEQKRRLFICAVIIRLQISMVKEVPYQVDEYIFSFLERKEEEKEILNRIKNTYQDMDEILLGYLGVILVLTGIVSALTMLWVHPYIGIAIAKRVKYLLEIDFIANQLIKALGSKYFKRIITLTENITKTQRAETLIWHVEKALLVSVDTPKDFLKKRVMVRIRAIRRRYFRKT